MEDQRIGCYSQEYRTQANCYPDCTLRNKAALCEEHRRLSKCVLITEENYLEMQDWMRNQ